ncbi:MAG TPA: PfkB family carbohydrate kinase [Thermoanaerobaculia bacterium]|jgi:ribokinase
MRAAEIVGVGGIATDIILCTSSLPAAGRCVMAREAYQGLGGKAANQAVAAARLGGSVALVGAVGSDAAGDVALARLAAEHVSVASVVRSPAGTGTVVIQKSDGGEKQTVVFPGANACVNRDTIVAAAPLLTRASVVVVQFEIPLDTVLFVVETIRNSEARVIVDASPVRTLPRELLAAAAVIKANAMEATALTGIDVRDLASARAAAARLLESGAAMIAIEAGGEGNLFFSRIEEVFLPLHDIHSIDATGAGDAMVGALAVALAEGRQLRDAAIFASAAAALATRALGAQTAMPTRKELEEWLAVRVDQ